MNNGAQAGPSRSSDRSNIHPSRHARKVPQRSAGSHNIGRTGNAAPSTSTKSVTALGASRSVWLDIPILPPGPYHSSQDDMDRDDDIQLLDEAPAHMRKITNKDHPIEVVDSDDEDPSTANIAANRKRKRMTGTPDYEEVTVESKPVLPPEVLEEEENVPKRARLETNLTADHFLPYVLEIIPDIDVDAALARLQAEIDAGQQAQCVERVIGTMFEMEGGYPKAKTGPSDEKGKKKAPEEPTELYQDNNYRSVERSGIGYFGLCQQELIDRFPMISLPHIRGLMVYGTSKLLPTYILLDGQRRSKDRSARLLKRPRPTIQRFQPVQPDPPEVLQERMDPMGEQRGAAEFFKERKILDDYISKVKVKEQEEASKQAAHDLALANGEGVECGCCFGTEVWSEMFQCSEGHLFCRECATMQADTKLGERSTNITCMDGSGCPAAFPESELKRFLSDKTLQLYHRLKQTTELTNAKIEGLETCPGCDYAVVIENPHEKLFKCLNKQCLRVTCRKCKEPDHIPRTCEEVAKDKRLDKRHAVEEAMTDALIRKCPTCAQPYVKTDGCNKIRCSNCGTMSCYICQTAISGYEHFDQNPQAGSIDKRSKKCILHDIDEKGRDHRASSSEQIVAARDAAQQDVREQALAQGMALEDEDLAVSAPDEPAAPVRNRGQYDYHPGIQQIRAVEQARRGLARANPAFPGDLRGLEDGPLNILGDPQLGPVIGAGQHQDQPVYAGLGGNQVDPAENLLPVQAPVWHPAAEPAAVPGALRHRYHHARRILALHQR